MLRTSCLLVLAFAGCAEGPTTASCERSIAAFCTDTTLPCPLTFAAAQDTASWGGCGDRRAEDSPLLIEYCGDVNVVEMWGIDASTNYYYDATSGELLSVTSHKAIRDQDKCIAGVQVSPQCSAQTRHDLCP